MFKITKYVIFDYISLIVKKIVLELYQLLINYY